MPLPANVIYRILPVAEFNALASSKLGLPIQVTSSYKLCDFRPAYGRIFEDYLEGCEFWGSSDIDLIFGDILATLRGALESHDVISVRKEWFSGSFSLYRNRRDVVTLFRESRDFAKVFTSTSHFGFDECSRLVTPAGYESAYIPLVNGVSIERLDTEIDSMTHVLARTSLPVFRETLITEGLNSDSLLEYTDGVICHYRGREVTHPLYYHFVGEKIQKHFRYPDWRVVPRRYFVDKWGFYSERELKWRKSLALFRRARGTVLHAIRNPRRAVSRAASYVTGRTVPSARSVNPLL